LSITSNRPTIPSWLTRRGNGGEWHRPGRAPHPGGQAPSAPTRPVPAPYPPLTAPAVSPATM
jgi:hypothetical protein